MSNVIVVPHKIKLGLYSILVEEKGEELIAVCKNCGRELNPHNFKSGMNYACESQWIFCSDDCTGEWIHENKPESGY